MNTNSEHELEGEGEGYNTSYEGEGSISDNIEIKKVIKFFQEEKLGEYSNAISANQITLEVFLSMSKAEICECLDIKIFGHIRQLELALDREYPGQHCWNGVEKKKNVQKQQINNPLMNMMNGRRDLLVGIQSANRPVKLQHNPIVNVSRPVAILQSNANTPSEVQELGGGRYAVSSTNVMACMGLFFMCLGAFILTLLIILLGDLLSGALATVLLTPGIFLILGCCFSKGGMGVRKHYSVFDDNKRTVSCTPRYIFPCLFPIPRVEKYDDVRSCTVGGSGVRVNGQMVNRVNLHFKNGAPDMILCTTRGWYTKANWTSWVNKRITPS